MSLTAILFIAIGGAFAFEGALWAILPTKMRDLYMEAFRMGDDRMLHVSGLISVAIGMVLILLGVRLVGG